MRKVTSGDFSHEVSEMTLRALIFDVDGTLAETEEAHRAAFNETFAEAGLPWAWDRETYRNLLKTTGGKERMRAHIDSLGDSAPAMSDDRIAALHRAKTLRYAANVAAGRAPLRPGVAALIGAARAAGLKLAIATTTSRPNVEALARAAFGREAGEIFDVMACGDEVKRKKPAPDVYLLALDRLGLDAADCLAFEDSRNGLLAAKGAGLAVVVTPGVYTDDEDFSEADILLPDLSGFRLP